MENKPENKGIILKRVDGEGIMGIHEQTITEWIKQFPKDRFGWCYFNFTELTSTRHEGTYFSIKPKPTKAKTP